jgi:hypothetical protein
MDNVEAQELGVSDDERAKRRNVLEKRSGADLKKKWEQSDRAALERRENEIAPETITSPRCSVCQSEHREWIEIALIKGHSYKSIADRVPPDEDGKGIDRRSIANHYQHHMDVERMVIRGELEAEARALQQNVEEGVQGALTDRGMLKVLARKAFDDVIKGVTTVEPKDLIQIIKLLHDLNENTANVKAEENEIALRTFVRSVQVVCDQHTIQKIVLEAERIRKQDDVQYAMEGILEKPLPELIEGTVVDGD